VLGTACYFISDEWREAEMRALPFQMPKEYADAKVSTENPKNRSPDFSPPKCVQVFFVEFESSSPSSRDVSEERSGRSFYSENEKEIDRLKKRSLKDTARIRSSKMLSRAGNKNKITALALDI